MSMILELWIGGENGTDGKLHAALGISKDVSIWQGKLMVQAYGLLNQNLPSPTPTAVVLVEIQLTSHLANDHRPYR